MTQDKLKKVIHYNPDTGEFTWLHATGKARHGMQAGWLASMTSRPEHKYRFIGIGNKNYLAHRLAFLYMNGSFPDGVVDHINHDGSDNRWINLRSVSRADNNRNMRKRFDNKTGFCGVKKEGSKFVAFIGVNSKQIRLGKYRTLSEAAVARKQAEKLNGYHDNHGTI